VSANFRRQGASSTKYCWRQKTRVIALSCGITISTVHYLVLLQSTCLSDRQTERRTDGENYDSQDRARIAASCGKMDHIAEQDGLSVEGKPAACAYLVTVV